MNLAALGDDDVARLGEYEALVVGTRTWTNRQLHDAAMRFASALIALGVTPGDRVMLVVQSGSEALIASSGTWRAGGVVVYANPSAPANELLAVVEHCSPAAIVGPASVIAELGVDIQISLEKLDELVAAHAPLPTPIERAAADPAQLVYTSGTTGAGRVKAAIYTHGGITASIMGRRALEVGQIPPIVSLVALPPTSFAGLVLANRWATQTKLIVLEKFDPHEYLATMAEHAVTRLSMVPTMGEALAAIATGVRFPALRELIASGAHMSIALADALERAFGIRPAITYGMTEVGGAISWTTRDAKPGSVGKIVGGVEVSIVDERGQPCAVGTPGEVRVKSPWMARGYWQAPDETAAMFRNGWIYTGDLGRLEADGELYLVGRSKDIIIQAGFNVSPRDVADVIAVVPGVAQCEVVGAPHAVLGEEVVACVVRAPNSDVAATAILAHCRAQLDPRKLPGRIVFFDAFPMTSTGKVKTAELRERVAVATPKDTPWIARLRKAPADQRLALVRAELIRIVVEGGGDSALDPTMTFGDLGLDSLDAVQLVNSIGELLGEPQAPTLTFKFPTIDQLAEHLHATLFPHVEAPPTIVVAAAPWVARLAAIDPAKRFAAIRDELVRLVNEATGIDADPALTFGDLGLDSLDAVQLVHALTELIGEPQPPTLTFKYPTIDQLAAHLDATLFSAPVAKVVVEAPVVATAGTAVIGVACRLPKASSYSQFWTVLAEGTDTVGPPPFARWGIEPDPIVPPGSYLEGIDQFDGDFFHLSFPPETVAPAQRVMLEVIYEALEDAGLSLAAVDGKRVGVFIALNQTGSGRVGYQPAMAVGHICHFFNLTGPAIVVDTACSSGLVAIHDAARSLALGECEYAIVATSTVIDMASVEPLRDLIDLAIIAPDGRSKSFSAAADGFGLGEGAIAIVLRRSHAANGGNESADRVRAVIRGSAVNHDGRSSSLTSPNPSAQVDVIRSALRTASVAPGEVQYIEAHGTGTVLGDAIELEALDTVFGKRDTALAVGAVKSNIGHIDVGAGLAGVVKVLLALEHRALPASRNSTARNPHVAWGTVAIKVQDTLGPWPAPERRLIAGVSSFGLGGTNAHVILEEGPRMRASDDGGSFALPVSAKTEAGLRETAARYAEALEHTTASVRDLSFTASRRTQFAHRFVAAGATREVLAKQLRSLSSTGNAQAATTGHLVDLPAYAWQHRRYHRSIATQAKHTPVPFVAPRGGVESALAQIWRELLELDRVGRDDEFFASGGNSRAAMQLVAQVRARLGVEMPVGGVFSAPRLSAYAALVEARLANKSDVFTLVRADSDTVRATIAQQYFWYLNRYNPDTTSYVQEHVSNLVGRLDLSMIKRAAEDVVASHSVFRTVFFERDGTLYQRVSPDAPRFELELGGTNIETAVAELHAAGMDLTRGRTIRGRLLAIAPDHYVMILLVHHAVTDAAALPQLAAEIIAHVDTFVAAPTVQYLDYAASLERFAQTPTGQARRKWWADQLRGAVPLSLPTDSPRAEVDAARARAPLGIISVPTTPLHVTEASAGVRERVARLAEREGTTATVVYLAALAWLYHELSHQTDLVIENAYDARIAHGVDRLQGATAAWTITRIDVAGCASLGDVVRRTKQRANDAFERSPIHDYYETVPTELRRVIFNYVPITAAPPQAASSLEVTTLPQPFPIYQRDYDISLMVVATPSATYLIWDAMTHLFRIETVRTIAERYAALLDRDL